MFIFFSLNVIKSLRFHMYLKYCIIILSVLTVSCSKMPEIEGFDKEAWKQDEFGCNGERNKLSNILETERQSLKGAQETDIIKILGQPNSIQIMERKQKYFTYWISNPSYCKDTTTFKALKIRISALNQVTEVLF